MYNSSSSNLFQAQQTPAINLFNPPPMNSSTNLFSQPYQPNTTAPSTGMVLRSGNTTNNQYTGVNTASSFFNTSLNSKNMFTPNQSTQPTNNPIFGQNKPSTDIFSGNNIGVNSIGSNNMQSYNIGFGSVDEKFNKLNHRYSRNGEQDKNLYAGTILAQSRHKDKNLDLVRLEDYSLIRQMQVPDELKGVIRKCISDKTFSEDVIKEEFRHQMSQPSFNGINPNIFSTNTNTNTTTNFINNQPLTNNQNMGGSQMHGNNNTLSFLTSGQNSNPSSNLFTKPTLSNNTNFFHQPTSQNTNNSYFNPTQNQNNLPSANTNYFNTNSTGQSNNNAPFFQTNQMNTQNNQPLSFSSAATLFKPPGQGLGNNSFNSNSFNVNPQQSNTNLFQNNSTPMQNTAFFQQPQSQQQNPPTNYFQTNQIMSNQQPQYPSTTNNSFTSYTAYPNNPYANPSQNPSMNLAYPQNQNPQPSYYPNPYSNYSYEQVPPYTPPSLNFSNEYSFDNSEKSFLFAKSKKIINISPYNEISNTFKEPNNFDLHPNNNYYPYAQKSMLYPMNVNSFADDFSLRDVPENLTNQYFREKKMYKNKPDDNVARNFINFRKKENSADDEDLDMMFNHRPKRFLETLEHEKMRRKGRSLSPGDVNSFNNRLGSSNQQPQFHVFQAGGVSVNIHADFGDKTKEFSFNLIRHTALKKIKNFIFRDKCQFEEKLCNQLIDHSYFHFMGEEISQEKTVDEAGIKNNDEIWLSLDPEGKEYYLASKKKGFRRKSAENNEIIRDYLPILTKPDYFTSPKFQDMLKFSKEQLEQVKDLIVFNNDITVQFEGPTDITYQNFDEIFEFCNTLIDVYPDTIFNENGKKKPNVGEKMNKPALITFGKCFLWKNKVAHEVNHKLIEARLKKMAMEQNAEFIKYDPKTGSYDFKVKHFTKYGAIEVEDSMPEDEQSEQESENQNALPKPTQPRETMDIEHQRHFTEFHPIPEESDENAFTEEDTINHQEKLLIEENQGEEGSEYDKFNYNDTEEVNNQVIIEEVPNPKRFKFSPTQFQVISSPYSPGPLQTMPDQKSIQEERDYSQEFHSFKNSLDQFFEYENQYVEEETKVSLYSKADSRLRKLNAIEENARKMIQPKQERRFYQNYSSRVSWCKDGFAKVGGNKNGSFRVEIHKVIVYPEFLKTKNGRSNIDEYNLNIKEYSKSLSLLFKTITEKQDFVERNLDSVERNIENLSIEKQKTNENYVSVERNIENLSFDKQKNNENYVWPEGSKFMQRIFVYIHKTLKMLKLQSVKMFYDKFTQEELFQISLQNILFGNPEVDFNRFFKARIDVLNDEKYFQKVYDKIGEIKPNWTDFHRKAVLNRWLESHATYEVAKEFECFKSTEYSFVTEEEIKKYNQEIIKIFLSGNQIHRAAEYALSYEYPKLALTLSSLSNKNSRKLINQGFELAEQYRSTDDFLMSEIYKIASGDFQAFEELDLTRWLGVYFWYSPLREESISKIFEAFLLHNQIYKNNFQGERYFSFYCVLIAYYIKKTLPSSKNQSSISSNEHFMKLSDPISNLHPLCFGKNPLDRKMMWIFIQFLFSDFQKANIFESFCEKKTDFNQFYLRLTRNFVVQLEILGLWDLAVVVLTHVPEQYMDSANRQKWVRQLIHRNYTDEEMDPGFKQKKTKLIQFSVPKQYFWEAKSYLYCYNFEWKQAIGGFLQAENFIECKEILINKYITTAILEILESKDRIQKKENLKELYKTVQNLHKNAKSTEGMKLKMQVYLFERLLKWIEMLLANHALKENDEKSLVNFSLDLSRFLNQNDLNDVLMMKIYSFVLMSLVSKNETDCEQGLVSEKLSLFENFMRNSDRTEAFAKNELNFNRKILSLLGILEKKRLISEIKE